MLISDRATMQSIYSGAAPARSPADRASEQIGGYARGLVSPVITGGDAVSRRGQRRRPIGLTGRALTSYRDVISTRQKSAGPLTLWI